MSEIKEKEAAPAPPTENNHCPPGLEYLLCVDQLLVKQHVEAFEMMTGFETANKYMVLNTMGQQVFLAAETGGNFCTRNCCGSLRSFEMILGDMTGKQIVKFVRPFKCTCRCCLCFCPCCLQLIEVQAAGETIGYVKQLSGCKPTFHILNASEEKILELVGPVCACSCCKDIPFEVKSNDGTKIGDLIKQFGGVLRENYTDADNFSISFPMDLDVKAKITLLAAVFLVDFMFFEGDGKSQRQ